MKIEMLPAFYGDCILINFKDENKISRNILIDGGIRRTYETALKKRLKKIIENNENIDLLVVTHIDDDHIGGIIKLFEDKNINKQFIKKVWFNSHCNIYRKYGDIVDNTELKIQDNNNLKTSSNQAITLEKKLRALNIWEEEVIEVSNKFKEYKFYGLKITVLTPDFNTLCKLNKKIIDELGTDGLLTASKVNDYDKTIDTLIRMDFEEDESITNKSSISFIIEDENSLKYLLLGDSHPTDVISSLKKLGYCKENKIKLEYIKLSHHASKRNLNYDLLEVLDCNKYIVSTNGLHSNLPNKQTLARILNNNEKSEIYFNYPDLYKKIFNYDERIKYNFYYKDILEVE
ncbi:MBL fold metallo-hydrolase [Clostridium butyricum]|uniref:MBL fold metallo-hydrolase n=1 Tax=Clostridium butyricum TaxID=1492 RepID=UPI0028FDB8A2|nr:MBL fold metallo-hydrolase [Clostridium butyricum]MDU0321148.1 MBL fold metallo-hydrolase [Clostridium butyricum]